MCKTNGGGSNWARQGCCECNVEKILKICIPAGGMRHTECKVEVSRSASKPGKECEVNG